VCGCEVTEEEEVIRENILGERDSSRKTFYNKCNFVLYSSISKSVETVRIPHKFHANYGNTHPQLITEFL
jgi:hypothetical protein